MSKMHLGTLLLAFAIGGLSGEALAAEQPVYGSQLMTNQERIEHRDKLRAARTAEERERIRQQHHEQMQARARQQGLSLPDPPPAQGGGMGQRLGPGGGMGGPASGGRGPGRNR